MRRYNLVFDFSNDSDGESVIYVNDDEAAAAAASGRSEGSGLTSNRRVIDSCRENVVNAPNIQNLLNQAPLGFTCSTKRFKQGNGIPLSTAVPEYMTSSQLSLRKMAQQALMSEIHRDGMNSKEAERRMLVIRDDFTSFAERHGQSGLRVMPGGGSFGSAAVAIEATHHKMTRRQLKIERKPNGKHDSAGHRESASDGLGGTRPH